MKHIIESTKSDNYLFIKNLFNNSNITDIININKDIKEKFIEEVNFVIENNDTYSISTINSIDQQFIIILKHYENSSLSVVVYSNDNDINEGYSIISNRGSWSEVSSKINNISNKTDINFEDLSKMCLVEGINGYDYNTVKFDTILEDKDDIQYSNDLIKELFTLRLNSHEEIKLNSTKLIERIVNKLLPGEDNKFSIDIRDTNLISYIYIIKEVYIHDNTKVAIIDDSCIQNSTNRYIRSYNVNDHYGYSPSDITYNNGIYVSNITFNYFNINKIPYEFIDKDRIIMILNDGSLLISNTPENDENYLNCFKEEFKNHLYNNYISRIRFIEINKEDIFIKSSENINNLIENVTKSINEYKFIKKDNIAETDDLSITENVSYHKNGEFKYKELSIKTDNDYIKNSLYNLSKDYTLQYFRETIDEETIIENVLKLIFNSIDTLIFRMRSEDSFNITFNNNVSLNICKKNKLIYVNGKTFRKNEIVDMIKELTCYQNQESANEFLKLVKKAGYSVFIGITSGYNYDGRIYKFKKYKKGNYVLLIDNNEIKVKKSLINYLFDGIYDNKYIYANNIDKMIEKSSTLKDYLNYYSYITYSYKSELSKSLDHLNEMIKEFDVQKTTYKFKNKLKTTEAVKVIGASGNTYIIAYTDTESFVFINPTLEGEIYVDGKYICMIDQSKTKKSIGYETVISKIAALKNDSIMSGIIHNLKEELGE